VETALGGAACMDEEVEFEDEENEEERILKLVASLTCFERAS